MLCNNYIIAWLGQGTACAAPALPTSLSTSASSRWSVVALKVTGESSSTVGFTSSWFCCPVRLEGLLDVRGRSSVMESIMCSRLRFILDGGERGANPLSLLDSLCLTAALYAIGIGSKRLKCRVCLANWVAEVPVSLTLYSLSTIHWKGRLKRYV